MSRKFDFWGGLKGSESDGEQSAEFDSGGAE